MSESEESNLKGLDEVPILDRNTVDNLVQLQQVTGRDILGDLLKTLLNEWPRWISNLEESVKADDRIAARNAAHYLKGSARTVGALRMGNLCESIQYQAENNSKPLDLELEQLKRLFPEVVAALKAI